VSTFERRRAFESFSNIAYVAGQGGILVFSAKFTEVENAGVVSVKQPSGTIQLVAQVVATGLPAGTVGTTPPAPNAIQLFIQQTVGATGVTEAPTGTIAGPITLLVEGQ